jgi:hypothetical protein
VSSIVLHGLQIGSKLTQFSFVWFLSVSRQNDTLNKTNPVIIIKKKNKQVIFRQSISVFNKEVTGTINAGDNAEFQENHNQ